MLLDPFKEKLSGKGLARYHLARLQPLPIRTAREVFPQAAHPMRFFVRFMCPVDHGIDFHLYASTFSRGWSFQSQNNSRTS